MAEKKASKNTSKKLAVQPMHMYGSIVFGVGLAIAIIAGLINFESQTINQVIGATLIILGLAVGILNITKEESVGFMVASIVLVSLLQPFMSISLQMFGLTQVQSVTQIVSTIFMNIVTFVVPAAIVVALKSAFSYAKDE